MKRLAFIGVGKMGLSHLAIAGAHPGVKVVGVADPSTFITNALKQYSNFSVFSDYKDMLNETSPDAVVVAVPTKFHDPIVEDLVAKGIHVFVEKPFTLNKDKGSELVKSVKEKKLVNQVGYHNKFIGTFLESKRIIESGALGQLYHFTGDINGPVIVKKKEATWRSHPGEGGGCLMDYAAHMIDLINYEIGLIDKVLSADFITVFSEHVEDAVFAHIITANGIHGSLNANWSDETYRKMSTVLTINGALGKLVVDTTEVKVYFKNDPKLKGYEKGWNIKGINLLTSPVDFYLRGEEYSAQMDYFIRSINGEASNSINTFESAFQTDKVIAKMNQFKNA
jgi:predicted dehydrogenase